mgnify:CR=1 FL=1
MPHIHTKPGQHDFTVSAFIIRTDFDEPKAMLHRHKKLGKWLQFGGHVELDENPWQAITHEILEETGYDMDQLRLLVAVKGPGADDAIAHPIPFSFNTHKFDESHNHTDIGYAFGATGKPNNMIGDDESADIVCFTRSELNDLPSSEIHDNTKQAFFYIFDNLL